VLAQEIAPGLLRWTAPHPEWRSDGAPGSSSDWEEMVGSVAYDLPGRLVLIDPLLPREGREEFLEWLDGRVAGRPVSILTTIRWHRRDRAELAGRYRNDARTAWNMVPPGVRPFPLRGAGETVYWLEASRALVAGDSLIGAGPGAVSLCPESWLGDVRTNRAGLAGLLEPLLELPLKYLLPSHGDPVTSGAVAALAHAIGEAGGRG
jgi:hypothetical protein